jgi:hypothetical protein
MGISTIYLANAPPQKKRKKKAQTFRRGVMKSERG